MAAPTAPAAVPAHTPIAILSDANTRWVSAELPYSGSWYGLLRARAGIHGPWENFTFVDLGGGQWAIRSNANGLYVAAEVAWTGGDHGILRARSSAVGPWERFTFVDLGGGLWAIKSVANSLYVAAELSDGGGVYAKLRARSGAIGAWEKFRFVPFQTRDIGPQPTYLVHGYGDARSCNQWNPAISSFQQGGWTRAELVTLGFYNGDTDCNAYLPVDSVNYYGSPSVEGGKDESLRELGREMSWEIYNRYSRFGITVDVVAHSMGGLIVRAMLTGTQRHLAGWAPYVFVEDVTTLSTPHGGVGAAIGCGLIPVWVQCKEMAPHSDFLVWLDDNPQSDIGTDWTLVGSEDDNTVTAGRATNMCCVGHKIIYPVGQPSPGIEHSNIISTTSGTYRIRYCDYFWSCDMNNINTWANVAGQYDPIRMARYGVSSNNW